jgi:hypothetical protein
MNTTSHASFDTLTGAQLATATGGVDCDSLRGISGRFKPEDASEVIQAQQCIADGHPLVKLVR